MIKGSHISAEHRAKIIAGQQAAFARRHGQPVPEPFAFDKPCEICGGTIPRRTYPSGALECPSVYRLRPTCGRKCGIELRKQRLAKSQVPSSRHIREQRNGETEPAPSIPAGNNIVKSNDVTPRSDNPREYRFRNFVCVLWELARSEAVQPARAMEIVTEEQTRKRGWT
jgi:hypothetical protein